MNIVVKAPNERSFILSVEAQNTSDSIIQSIKDIKGWKNFTLYYHKKLIYTSQKIQELNIQQGSQLKVCFPLYGGQKIKVVLQDADKKDFNLQVDSELTGFQLKKHIYDNVTQSLEVQSMKVTYAGVKIEDDIKLSHYKIIQKGGVMKIVQHKNSLDQIAKIIKAYDVDYNGDPISGEETAAKLPCGHVIGQLGASSLVKYVIAQKKYIIRCVGQKPDGSLCKMQLDYNFLLKIGSFTLEQRKKYEEGLSKNWLNSMAIQCPSCKYHLSKTGLGTNKIRCPNCNYGDFCAYCLKKWLNNTNKSCGNEQCQSINQFLKALEWNTTLKLKKEDGSQIQVNLPDHRACPSCKILIKKDGGCKHMTCDACKTRFCWICLDTPKLGWNCGSYSSYCGKVAQTQIIQN